MPFHVPHQVAVTVEGITAEDQRTAFPAAQHGTAVMKPGRIDLAYGGEIMRVPA